MPCKKSKKSKSDSKSEKMSKISKGKHMAPKIQKNSPKGGLKNTTGIQKNSPKGGLKNTTGISKKKHITVDDDLFLH